MRAMWNDGPDIERHLEPDGAPAVALRSICSVGGGGGGQQQSYSSQQSEAGPPSFLQPYLKQGVSDLWSYYTANPNAPAYYSGETVAPLSTQTQGAVGLASNLAGNNPTLTAANGTIQDFLGGKYLDPTSNPDFQKALDVSHQPYIDQFNTQVLPGITSAFEGSGRTGSGLHQASVDQATTNLNRTIAGADAQAGSSYYTDALGKMLQAGGLTPGINSANWQDVSGLGAAGSTVDQQRQAQDTSNKAAYDYNASSQLNYISQVMSMLNGAYPGGTSTSSGNSTTYQPTNTFSQLFGSGLGLAGLGLQAASTFGWSDERLKEDISEPIGATFEGIPIRRWRYRGDPTPHVGFIAQEVERIKPEAVAMHPSGYRMVNYDRATNTEPQGLF